MKKISLLFLLSGCLVFGLCRDSLALEDKIIAVVNKDIITQKDLDGFINFMRMQLGSTYRGEELDKKIVSLRADLMERLIEDRLIMQEAKKSGIKINNDKVKARVGQVKKAYPSDTEFQAALKQQGLSQLDIETRIREQLLMYSIIEIKIKSKIAINPGEVTEFYQKNKENLVTPEERQFQAITVESEEQAMRIFGALRNNEDPAKAAERYGAAVNKLNAYAGSQLKKEVEEIVFKLKPGEVSHPAKINNKYYIFKLDNIVPPKQENLLDAQDKIYNILLDRKMQQGLAAWIEELKKQSYIEFFKESQ